MSEDKLSEDKLSLKEICDIKCNNYKCCTSTGPAILFEEEVEKIRKYAIEKGLRNIDDHIEKTKYEEIFLLIRGDYHCPYLDKGNCLIQDIKPIDCEMYPLGLNSNGDLGIDKNNECPATEFLSDKFFETVEDIVNEIPLDIRKKMGKINEQNGYFYVPIKD